MGQDLKNTYLLLATNSNSSKFTECFLQNGQSFGKIENVMQILHSNRKHHYINKMEKFHIYKETINDIELNDRRTLTPTKCLKQH
jgi:hypothetical protein